MCDEIFSDHSNMQSALSIKKFTIKYMENDEKSEFKKKKNHNQCICLNSYAKGLEILRLKKTVDKNMAAPMHRIRFCLRPAP